MLHNLRLFDRDIAVLSQHTALNLFALLMGVVFPLAYRFSPFARRWFERFNFPMVPLAFALFFVVGLVHGQTIQKLYPHWAHTEIKELVFSVGFLLFGISTFAGAPRAADRNPSGGSS